MDFLKKCGLRRVGHLQTWEARAKEGRAVVDLNPETPARAA